MRLFTSGLAIALFLTLNLVSAIAQAPRLALPTRERDLRITLMHPLGSEVIVGARSGFGNLANGGLWRIGTSPVPVELFGAPYAVFSEWKGEKGTWVASGEVRGIRIQNINQPERDAESQDILGNVEGVSSDGRWAAIRRGDATLGARERLVIRDLHTGKDRELPVEIASADLFFSNQPETLAIVRQGSGTGPRDNREAIIEVWNVRTGTRFARLATRISLAPNGIFPGPFSTVAFSSDGTRLAAAYNDYTVRVWVVASGTQERSFQRQESVAAMRFSPDNRELALGFFSGAAETVNALDGRTLVRFPDAGSRVESLQFVKDSGLMLVANAAGTIAIYEAANARALGHLFLNSLAGDWLATTPEGSFDGSEAAWKEIQWKFEGRSPDTLPVEAFFADYFSPGILGQIISGQPSSGIKPVGSIDRLTPTLQLRSDSPPETSERMVSIEIAVEGATGAKDLRLFRNGVLIQRWAGDTPAGSRVRVDAIVIAGTNAFSAYAFNADGVRTSEVVRTITGASTLARVGDLYVLAVGIDAYPNSEYKLAYAVADARAVADRLKAGRDEIRRFAHQLQHDLDIARSSGERISDSARERATVLGTAAGATHVRLLLDADATRDRILDELRMIATAAKPEDAVVVFFSGHGTSTGPNYYLIPHDFGYTGPRANGRAMLDTFRSRLISDDDLNAALEPMQAGVAALIIDACESGILLDTASDARRGPINSRGLAQLAYEKGIYLLAAAQNYQSALESSRLGHGLLTYTLAEQGLGKESPLFQNVGEGVTLPKLLEFAATRLPYIKDQDAKARQLTTADRGPQQPRLMRRRIPETMPLVIALTPMDPLAPKPLTVVPPSVIHDPASEDKPQRTKTAFVFAPAGVGMIANAEFLQDGRLVTANKNGFIDIWQVPELIRVARIPVSHAAAIAVAPSGDTIAVLTADTGARPGIVIIDTKNARIERTIAEISRQSASNNGSLMWSRDGRHLLATVNDAALILDATTGALARRLEHPGANRSFFTEADTATVSVSLFDGEVRLWRRWSSPDAAPAIKYETSPKLQALAIDSARQRLAVLTKQSLQVFDVSSGKRIGPPIKPGFECDAAAFGESSIYISGRSRDVLEFSLADGSQKSRFQATGAPYVGGLVGSDHLLIGFGLDDVLAVWDRHSQQLLRDGTATRRYSTLKFTDSGALLLAGTAPGTVLSTELGAAFSSKSVPVIWKWRIRPHGGSSVLTGDDSGLSVWNASSLTRATVAGKMDAASVSADGSAVVYCAQDRGARSSQLYVWHRSSGTATRFANKQPHECPGLDITGNFVATTYGDEVVLFDAGSGKRTGTLRGTSRELESLHFHAFSADGALGVFATNVGVTIYRLSDRQPMASFEAPGLVTAIDFSPDHRSVIVGTLDGGVAIVDLETKRATHHPGGGGKIEAVAVSPSGQVAAALRDHGTTDVYRLLSGELIATIHPGSGADEWLVQAEDGRFDASDAMLKKLMVRSADGGAAPAPSGLLGQYTPRLLAAIVQGEISR
jgi:WD40 repeat protein